MTLTEHRTLIQNLPVRRQCFTTKRSTWNRYEQQFPGYAQVNDELFNGQSSLTLSRDDVFRTEEIKHLILKAIYWGYPRGMRGNHLGGILASFDQLTNIFSALRDQEQRNEASLNNLRNQLSPITGLGLSTYSKILYFLGIKFNDQPCLILDKRLMDVFNSNIYEEFNHFPNLRIDNAQNHYLNFLNTFSELADQLETKGENIEQFLFIFGNGLK